MARLARSMGVTQIAVLRALSGVRRRRRPAGYGKRQYKARLKALAAKPEGSTARMEDALRDFGTPKARENKRERELILIERLVRIPLWQIKMVSILARVVGCSQGKLYNLIRKTPLLAEMRRARQLRASDLEKIDGWASLSAEEIGNRLSIPVVTVKIFLGPVRRVERTGAPEVVLEKSRALVQRRIAAIRGIPGWQVMSLREIADRLGVTAERLRQLISEKPEMKELFQRHQRNGWGLTMVELQALHDKYPTAEEVMKAIGATPHHYAKLLKRFGMQAQIGRRETKRRAWLVRLKAIPGWESLTYEDLAERLNQDRNWVCEQIQRNPELLKQRLRRVVRREPSRNSKSGRA